MGKIKENAKVRSQEMLTEGIYSMWIETGIANEARPGQFISVYTKDESRLLPRPISICDIDRSGIRIVYRVAGEGTKEFSGYKAGDDITILGPLGNGFPLIGKRALLFGGGIGIPPMLALAKALPGEVTVVAGYRDSNLFLDKELSAAANIVIATDDGSIGTHGTVITAAEENQLSADVIYACGPRPMLRGVKEYAKKLGIDAYISMEERMACGIGACLGCVCHSTEKDEHSNGHTKRVCKDGPVFLASEVEL